MDIVLDTVSLSYLINDHPTSANLFAAPKQGKYNYRLAVDDNLSLVDEWCQTCGKDIVASLLGQWEPFGGILRVSPSSIPYQARRKLNQLAFTDTIDKLIIRIALSTVDRTIVSDDCDFWDPDPTKRGSDKGCIALLLRKDLNVRVCLLIDMLS